MDTECIQREATRVEEHPALLEGRSEIFAEYEQDSLHCRQSLVCDEFPAKSLEGNI